MQVLIDSNILVRLREMSNPLRTTCWNAVLNLQRQQASLLICTQSLIEFWSVSTRPVSANGLGQSISQTLQDCNDFISLFTLLPEPPDIATRWLQIVSKYQVQGKQAHDARMVALAGAYGINHILTLNSVDFARFTEIAVIDPLSLQ